MALTNDIISRKQFLDIYYYDTLLGIRDKEITILKNRYGDVKGNLSFEETEDFALELICKSLEIFDYQVFSEEFKKTFKSSAKKIIDEYKIK